MFAAAGMPTFLAGAFNWPSHFDWTTWPLKPGTYEIRFLVDDSYRSIAVSAKLKVVKP